MPRSALTGQFRHPTDLPEVERITEVGPEPAPEPTEDDPPDETPEEQD